MYEHTYWPPQRQGHVRAANSYTGLVHQLRHDTLLALSASLRHRLAIVNRLEDNMASVERLWTSLRETFKSREDDDPVQEDREPTPVMLLDDVATALPLPTLGSSTVPTSLLPEIPMRMRFRQRFIDLYLGDCMYARSNILPEITEPNQSTQTGMSSAAIDALSVGIVATFLRHERLMSVAKALYAQAAYILDKRIRQVALTVASTPETEDILSTTHTLLVCSHLDCISGDNRDWSRYNLDLSSNVRQYGWPSPNLPVRKIWLERTLYSGLIARRRIKPQIVGPSSPMMCNSFIRACAAEVPELLEETDRILFNNGADPQPQRSLTQHLTQLGAIKASIKKLHLKWTLDLPLRFHLANIKTFRDFLHPPRSTIFTSALRFRRLACEAEYRASVLCLLEVSQAILDINLMRSESCTGVEFALQLDLAREDARSAADTLCMLIPRCLEPESGAASVISSLTLLHFASKYYRRYELAEQFAWCEHVRLAVKNKFGISIKAPNAS